MPNIDEEICIPAGTHRPSSGKDLFSIPARCCFEKIHDGVFDLNASIGVGNEIDVLPAVFENASFQHLRLRVL